MAYGSIKVDSVITSTGSLDLTAVPVSGQIDDADIAANAAIALSKLANVSATDKLLGRSSAGAGPIQEITCTSAGRALLDDADAAAQRTTLGLGSLATQSSVGNISSSGAIGSTANLPVITGASGALQAGSFGTGANTFCQGNDSRLSDTRTPTDGSVTNAKVATNAAIAGSKIDPDFGAQNIKTTGTLAVGQASAAANTDLDLNGTYAGNVVAMGALDVDCSTGNYFTKTISGNSTFTFSNVPASRAYGFTLELTHTSGTVTWPAAVKWPGDTAPSLTTGKTHLFTFVTDDGGSRWRGAAQINYVN